MPGIRPETNSPLDLERQNKLKTLGKNIFSESSVATSGVVSATDVTLARRFMTEGAKITNPKVRASYWEHILIAPELGKRIADQMAKTNSSINPHGIEFLLFVHDIGRLVTPAAFFKNDLLGDRLLLAAGIPKNVVGDLPPIGNILVKADELQLTESQTRFEEPFTPEQLVTADAYFESLTPAQRIIFFADNLGKRDDRGLFDLDSFFAYLKDYDASYDSHSLWPTIEWATLKRKATLPFVLYIIEKTVEWFYQNGVDVEEIMTGLEDYGPKFVLIARHGELDNPTNIVYNRDTVMKEPIHLNKNGQQQMRSLGELIRARKFRLTKIFTSPETRTQESTMELNRKLGLPTEIVDDLDDVFAPYPYRQGWTMDKLMALNGNNYILPDSETPESVTNRMLKVFDTAAANLKIGETAILVSHGDPVAFLANYLDSAGIIPNPQDLRSLIYPAKGQALVAVIGPDGKLFTLYSLSKEAGENVSTY